MEVSLGWEQDPKLNKKMIKKIKKVCKSVDILLCKAQEYCISYWQKFSFVCNNLLVFSSKQKIRSIILRITIGRDGTP